MSLTLKNRMIKLVDRVGYLLAALPLLGGYFYKFAKIIVKYRDNNANSDFYTNGECYLLNYFIKKQLLKTVFDVGANLGEYTSLIAGSKSQGTKIYAFDPRSSNIEYLKKRFNGDGRIVIIEKALSDYDGSIDFYQNDDLAQSGADSVYNMAAIGYFCNTRKVSVPCATIDSFSAKHQVEHIDLVKIDVEGHELFVLKGAKRLLEKGNIDYIQFEYGHAARAARVFLIDLVNFLQAYGYRIYIIYPKGIKPFRYSPWEENRFDMINFLAVSSKASNNINSIILRT